MQLTILYVCCARSWRGGEQQLINLFWALEKKGHRQIIFCVKNSAVEAYCKENNIHHYPFKKRGGADIAAAFKLKKIVTKKEKIDILFLNDSDAHTMGYLASMLLGLKTPTVLTRKKVLPIRTFLSVKKYNAAFISYIICVSATVKEILSEKIEDKSKLVVVHEGIQPPDEVSIAPFILPDNIQAKNFDYLIGYTAALTGEKDHYTFLKTAAVLVKEHKKNIGFIIAGDGVLKDDISRKIQEMGLAGNVFILGFINNIPSLLRRLNLLLFTSQSEAFSISILEAFYLQLPVISTTWRGVNEMIEHEKTGLLSPIEDVNSLTANVLRLLGDEGLQETLSQNAYHFVKQYNYDAMAAKIEQVFFKMLQ
jgi:glycosyltransferase involved in cell wall biosynthesis